jgi:hypothetical protein
MGTDHNVAVKMEIWQAGQQAASYVVEQIDNQLAQTSTTPGLVITDGSVTMDKDQDQRFQCTVTCVSPDGSMIPGVKNNLLTPWGNEIRLYRGVFYPETQDAEYVPLGIFRMSSVDIKEQQGTPTITITGYDRSRNIARNVVPYYWPDLATQNAILFKSWANMIQVALADRWSKVQFNDTAANWQALVNDPTFSVIGAAFQSFSEGTDLFDQMRQYAMAAGCELFFYRDGICYFRRDPNFSNHAAGPYVPVLTLQEGATATFDQMERTLDDAGVYNQVIVIGGGTTLGGVPLFTYPPNGTPAIDNDPTSKTYIGVPSTDADGNPVYTGGSPFGVVTHVVNNNLLTTIQQCQDFAQLQLIVDLGSEEGVQVPSMMVNPCLDVDDIIDVIRTRLGLVGKFGYIVNQAVVPLMAGSPMTLTLKEKKQLSIGSIASVRQPQKRTKTITGRGFILRPHTAITRGRYRIEKSFTHTISGKGKISTAPPISTATITGIGRIMAPPGPSSTITGIGRIAAELSTTITGVGTIYVPSATITGVARISNTDFTFTNILSADDAQPNLGVGTWTDEFPGTITLSSVTEGLKILIATDTSEPSAWTDYYDVTAGEPYTFMASVKAASTTNTFRLAAQYYDSMGGYVGEYTSYPWVTDNTSSWSQILYQMVAPAGAATVRMSVQGTGFTDFPPGEIHYVNYAGIFLGWTSTWIAP